MAREPMKTDGPMNPPLEDPQAQGETQRARRRRRRTQAHAEGRCLGHNRRGARCGKPPLPGRAVCKFHGGAGGGVVKSGAFVELAGPLKEAVDRSLNDPRTFELEDAVAVLHGLAKIQAKRLAELDTPRFRDRALDLFETWQSSKPEHQAKALQNLYEHLERGADETDAERELTIRVERTARQVAELKAVQLSRANVIPARDAVNLVLRVCEIIRQVCPNEDLARQIVLTTRAKLLTTNGEKGDELSKLALVPGARA